MKLQKQLFRMFLASTACSVMVQVVSGQSATTPPAPPVTLKVGDLAPPVAGVTWLKGQPLRSLADGKIHVVEFWATWCGPCKAAMPELSRLAAEYRHVATFTGIDVFENLSPDKSIDYMPKVKSFVDAAHAKMAYNVGADGAGGQMASAWMQAAGQRGIPATFVVDGDGRIAYIGHPIFLPEVLPKILDHTFSATEFQVTKKSELDKFSDFEGRIDKASEKGDSHEVLALYSEFEKALPWEADDVDCKRYVLLAICDPAKARPYGLELVKRFSNSPMSLCMIAQAIAGATDMYIYPKGFGSIKDPDLSLALKAANQARACSDSADVFVNLTFAKVYFKAGEVAKAVEYQTRVIKTYENDKTMPASESKEVADLKKTLDSYQAAAKSDAPKRPQE